jgi:hypothetical protein
VLILKIVKVVCFVALLQVLIPKNLHCTKIMQDRIFLVSWIQNGFASRGPGGIPKKEKPQKGLPHSKISRGIT